MSRTMSRMICHNLKKDGLVANSAPNATDSETNAKRSLFADLEPSEPDDRQVDRPTLLTLNTPENATIPIGYDDSTAASQ
jgi:hypothetical protein